MDLGAQDDFRSIATSARGKARRYMYAGSENPAAAREWLEVAAVAEAAAQGSLEAIMRAQITVPEE